MAITTYFVTRKVTAPVLEFYRVLANPKDFADDEALHDHLMDQIALLSTNPEEANAIPVDSQVLPYEGKPEFRSAKAENLAVSKANAEASLRSITDAKKKACELAKEAKASKS